MSFSLTDRHIIVNYHYVEDPRPDRKGIFPCSVFEFRKQIEFLSKNYSLASPYDVVEAAHKGKEDRLCGIVFDDGLEDQYENACPSLKEYKIEALFFPIVGTWSEFLPATHALHAILSLISPGEFVDHYNFFCEKNVREKAGNFFIPKDKRLNPAKRLHDDIITANIKERFITLHEDLKERILMWIFEKLNINSREVSKSLFMSKEKIVELSKDGFLTGSHTCTHRALDVLGDAEAFEELKRSHDEIEKLLGVPARAISYPSGRFNTRTREHALKAGFTYGFTIERRGVMAGDDPLFTPRYDANDIRDFLATI